MLLLLLCAQAEQLWTRDDTIAMIDLLENQPGAQVPEKKRIIPGQSDLSETKGLDERRMNILLMSSDAASMRKNFGKTEAVFVLSVHLDKGEMRLLSLPGDAVIGVEGLPAPVPLRYVNCFGGPRLLMRSLNQALGLNIRRYCAVNLQAFSAGVDALQGVQLLLTEAEMLEMGLSNTATRLTGDQAYRFVQSAKGSGAGGRASRVIEAAAGQLMDEFTLGTALNLAGTMLPLIDCNLNIFDMGRLLRAYLNGNGGMDSDALECPAGVIGEDQKLQVHACFYGEDKE